MEENIPLRLKKFIAHLGTNDSNFADSCGISRSTLSLILSGRNKKINDQQIAQIHIAYPDLSVLWLMFGEGPMLNNVPDSDQKDETGALSDHEILKNWLDVGDERNNETLSALTQSENTVKLLSSTQLKLQEKIQNLELKISKLESEPRRVSKITIFYDDSTFETFIPEK